VGWVLGVFEAFLRLLQSAGGGVREKESSECRSLLIMSEL
jgi:hypothetical protein